jgi:multidrug transporter EmrE-like cation transporter
MEYLWLAIAILFEVGWAIAMKLSHGLTRPGPTAATIVMYLLSVVFLSFATKRMEVGTAYAIWAGTGVALIALAGVVYFKEPLTVLKVISLLLIVLGIVGVQMAGGGH